MHDAASGGMSPVEGLQALVEGNCRYVAGEAAHPRQDASRRGELVSGQHPFAIVIACSDSRAPVELLFDCGFGDLFVIRTAGHILDEAVLASAQYAAEHLGTRLIVVLGHSNCGAVKSVVENAVADGHLGSALEKLKPIVPAAAARVGKHGDLVAAAVTVNIENAVATLKALPWAKELDGLEVVGMRYDLKSGQVAGI
ncbi:MAG: carbonic anhydrase [Acidobacteriota bacterium]|jgi:carbonic anhydrase|nr:carbonic anhydrase [Acidobacteriota bacterium]